MPTTKKAGTKKAAKASGPQAATTGGKTLTVAASRQARFPKIVLELERAFKRGGCPGCRSGIDRIVFQDQVLPEVR
jgi:hypothetical protein